VVESKRRPHLRALHAPPREDGLADRPREILRPSDLCWNSPNGFAFDSLRQPLGRCVETPDRLVALTPEREPWLEPADRPGNPDSPADFDLTSY